MAAKQNQRLVIGMMDGMGMPVYRASRMPILNRMEREGNLFRTVRGIFPSVTNVNNVSIACGSWPAEHGITANSYFDPELGLAVYMNDARLIRVKTVFQRAAEWGIKSALLTSKKKTAELFRSGTEICLAAEAPDAAFLFTADHGMNNKKRAYDLEKVREIITGLEGVERVMDSGDAAEEFHTDASRIGDLVVFGDIDTMFGQMDHPMEALSDTYRAHGSMHEMELPLIIYNYDPPLPRREFFNNNLDLTRFLFRV